MIDTIDISLIIGGVFALAVNHYFHFYRNCKVYEFRRYVLDLVCSYNVRNVESDNEYIPLDAVITSYNDMLYSFKPLKLEYWYDKQLIERLLK